MIINTLKQPLCIQPLIINDTLLIRQQTRSLTIDRNPKLIHFDNML